MSLSELLIVILVALVVFGPEKLPELAHNLGKLAAKGKQLKQQFNDQVQQHQLQFQLEENEKKAAEADKAYGEGSPRA